MKKISILLYVLGLLVAVVSAARVTELTWQQFLLNPSFLAGTALCIIGLVFWRIENKKGKAELHNNSVYGDPRIKVKEVLPLIKSLSEKSKEMNPKMFRDELDHIVENYIYPISESKDYLVEEMGLAEGSELYLKYSYAERMLNRAWSYSSDDFNEGLPSVFEEVIETYEGTIQA